MKVLYKVTFWNPIEKKRYIRFLDCVPTLSRLTAVINEVKLELPKHKVPVEMEIVHIEHTFEWEDNNEQNQVD